jgi:hypothetical protein
MFDDMLAAPLLAFALPLGPLALDAAPGLVPAAVSVPAAAPSRPVTFDLGAGTYFPTSFVVEGTLELPWRILVQADLGWMPEPYSNTIVDLMGAFGVLTSTEENLLKLAIQNSFVAHFGAGWRPFTKLGLELTVGYTLIAVGGAVSGADVIQAYLESKNSSDTLPADANHGVPLSATLHNFQANVGWRFLLLGDRLVLRASLGYIQTLASSVGVSASAPRPGEQFVVNRVNSDISNDLGPYFAEYAKAPLVGLTLAYRF